MTLYAWPAKTAHGRVIPKTRIYDGASATRAVQAKFVAQVERMDWTHVLRPDTLNLKAADGVSELAVVAVTLHRPDVDTAVLAAIERAIPRPLVIELSHGARTRLCMAWKRPSLAGGGQWVTSPHFMGPWLATAWRRAQRAAHCHPRWIWRRFMPLCSILYCRRASQTAKHWQSASCGRRKRQSWSAKPPGYLRP